MVLVWACDSGPTELLVARVHDGVAVPVDACGSGAASPQLRRLTREEYDHTVRDLLGDTTRPANVFVPDEERGGYRVGLNVSPALFSQYGQAAERLAADATALAGCEPIDRACASAFVERFGRRAYRRPLERGEIEALLALFDEAAARTTATGGLEVVIATMLQSPHFLYRIERTRSGRLAPYEIASSLSYFLWQSMPDDALLEAAANGTLDTDDGVELEARRLLDDPRADDAIASFHEQWLEIGELPAAERDPDRFPEFSMELALSMLEETRRFAIDTVRNDGRLTTLLRSRRSFADAPLAAIYGVDPPPEPFGEVELGPERLGILTHASVLAVHAHSDQTSPVRRGAFVRARLLCQDVPPPPDDRPLMVPPAGSAVTARERLALHRTDPVCASCHTLMDPIGLGFENYDAIGRYRTEEGGMPIDASGEVTASLDADGEFVGAVELAERLASSRAVSDCYATQWYRFAMGRRDVAGERCVLDDVAERFAESGDIRELLVDIATSRSFLHREVRP
jgi:hypothetical protein